MSRERLQHKEHQLTLILLSRLIAGKVAFLEILLVTCFLIFELLH